MKLFVKYLLITIGSIATVLGIIGIFLPLLPTTPFLLLGAACFIRSSEKLYGWLVGHKRLGPYIENFRSGRGIPRKAKIYIIALLWVSISFSIYIAPYLSVKILFFLCAATITLYILRMKTLHEE